MYQIAFGIENIYCFSLSLKRKKEREKDTSRQNKRLLFSKLRKPMWLSAKLHGIWRFWSFFLGFFFTFSLFILIINKRPQKYSTLRRVNRWWSVIRASCSPFCRSKRGLTVKLKKCGARIDKCTRLWAPRSWRRSSHRTTAFVVYEQRVSPSISTSAFSFLLFTLRFFLLFPAFFSYYQVSENT